MYRVLAEVPFHEVERSRAHAARRIDGVAERTRQCLDMTLLHDGHVVTKNLVELNPAGMIRLDRSQLTASLFTILLGIFTR